MSRTEGGSRRGWIGGQRGRGVRVAVRAYAVRRLCERGGGLGHYRRRGGGPALGEHAAPAGGVVRGAVGMRIIAAGGRRRVLPVVMRMGVRLHVGRAARPGGLAAIRGRRL